MIIEFLKKHRTAGLIAVAVAIYAALGFYLAPWLIQKTLVDSSREGYGAELSIDKVEVNPFVLSIRINGLDLDDPDGAKLLDEDVA